MGFQAPESALVSSFYGEKADVTTPTMTVNGVEVAPVRLSDGFREYEKAERSPKKCIADDETCDGWKAKGTPYCIGHLRSMAKAQKEAREA